jgi:ubiquinol-cytochrome c reductase cytochrome b subunit
VGVRILPPFTAKGGAFFAVTVGVIAIMAGSSRSTRSRTSGRTTRHISAGSQPDFYMGWSDGMARLFPAWDIHIGGYNVPPVFWAAAVFLPLLFLVASAYPWVECRFTKDNARHNQLQRPRDVLVRTSLGVMGITFYLVLLVSSANDLFAYFFDVSLNATTWMGRIGLLVLPPIAYYVTYRICIGLQRGDQAVLEHGIETGIIRRLPHGEFAEVHQPLAGIDAHGHAIPLADQGAPVPKRMNRLRRGCRPGARFPAHPGSTGAERGHGTGTPVTV